MAKLMRISTRTRRNEEVERPEVPVMVYFRVYCPGKHVPSVKDNAVHLQVCMTLGGDGKG